MLGMSDWFDKMSYHSNLNALSENIPLLQTAVQATIEQYKWKDDY